MGTLLPRPLSPGSAGPDEDAQEQVRPGLRPCTAQSPVFKPETAGTLAAISARGHGGPFLRHCPHPDKLVPRRAWTKKPRQVVELTGVLHPATPYNIGDTLQHTNAHCPRGNGVLHEKLVAPTQAVLSRAAALGAREPNTPCDPHRHGDRRPSRLTRPLAPAQAQGGATSRGSAVTVARARLPSRKEA